MRYALLVLAAAIVAGCSGDIDPVRPGPSTVPSLTPPQPTPTSSRAFVWGMVIDGTGVCIPGGTVRVMAGQRVGESLTQDSNCDAWSYDGGFWFTELTPGEAMTLLVTAPGYGEQQKTVVPTSGGQMAVLFTPPKK